MVKVAVAGGGVVRVITEALKEKKTLEWVEKMSFCSLLPPLIRL
jgi:hypothetical protein